MHLPVFQCVRLYAHNAQNTLTGCHAHASDLTAGLFVFTSQTPKGEASGVGGIPALRFSIVSFTSPYPTLILHCHSSCAVRLDGKAANPIFLGCKLQNFG
jgi:hypothetical protein